MAKFSNDVWTRRGVDEISVNTYNLIFGLTTGYGLFVFGLLINAFFKHQMSGWESLLYMLISFAGCFIAASEVPIMNLLGLTMIAGGLGAICGPFFGHYKVDSIINISAMTLVICLVLGAIGWMYPKSLANWGTTLFTLLIALIIAQVLCAFFLPTVAARHALDWIGILLFSVYIVYDFNRAQHLPKTIDNAMDSGISVFLDFANILIRLMSLFGETSSDD
jgi:FtsH-binding integral membrane protein